MALSLAIDDITPDKVTRKIVPGGPGLITTTFFRAAADTLNAPTVFLVRQDPEFFNGIHYHAADEFQIVIEGKGKFGRHEISPYYLHFARAYTPYGPLLPDRESGWSFVTLRARYDPGAQHLPAAREKLKQIPNRRPWQISKKICFPDAGSGAAVHAVEGMSDDQGLFAYTLSMAPATLFVAPEPSKGGGQFVVILKGSMVDDRERKALAVAFVKPEEKALEIRAGAEGLQGLILNLPKVNSAVAADAQRPAGVSGSRKWQCALCGFAYSEALGIPHDGIAPGTHWADVPDSWTCPDCGASKNDFEMVEA